LHTNEGDAIEALQAKVGVTNSAVSSSHDYRLGRLESKVPQLNVVHYGASTGAADNSTYFQDAIDALPSSGGAIYVPPGVYNFTSGVTVTAGKEVLIYGNAGWTSTVALTTLQFTGTGSGSFIAANSSVGVTLRDLGINYNSTSYAGRLLDFRNVSASDSAYWIIDHCSIGGIGVGTSTAIGLAIDKAIDGTIRNCHFYANLYAIDGMVSGTYANGITVEGCVFRTSETAHIHNVAEAWTITGNIFEGLRGGGAGAIKNDSGILVQGGIIAGNWMGDVTSGAGGSQFDCQFMGTQVTGNYIGAAAGSTGITVQDGSIGFQIVANRFAGCETGISLGINCNGFNVNPNSYAGVTTLLGGATAHGAGYVRNVSAAITGPIDVYRNTSSADGRCVVRYQADRSSTKIYDMGVDPEGGITKSFAVRDVSANAVRLKVPTTGGLVVGSAALATTATGGFLYVPTCAGTPTGTPGTETGTAPVVYDTAADKLWIYNGTWKSATFA
jgi:hypothetical protein